MDKPTKPTASTGYLFWFIKTYGWKIRMSFPEMVRDSGMTRQCINTQILTLEKLGYFQIDRTYRPMTISIDKERVLRELGIDYEGV